MVITPLYGHTSEDTAYVVADYPYGRTIRTQIRYWIEHKPSKGYRFVSQTKNPKTYRWNAVKCSTYTEFAAAMYLDENGHVQWTGLGQYSDLIKFQEFVKSFPDYPGRVALVELCKVKAVYYNARVKGAIVWTVNNTVQTDSEAETERNRLEAEAWKALADRISLTIEST